MNANQTNQNAVVKPIVGLDTGEPPAAVLQHQEKLKAMLAGEPPRKIPGAVKASDEVPTQPIVVPPIATPRPTVAAPPEFKNTEKVELTYFTGNPDVPSFSLNFMVGEVCFREHYISMLIVSDIGFKPTNTMRFDLKHKGKIYHVIFAGAEFEFQTLGVRGISFLVDKTRSHDQARQS